jgi:hypothetical protein
MNTDTDESTVEVMPVGGADPWRGQSDKSFKSEKTNKFRWSPGVPGATIDSNQPTRRLGRSRKNVTSGAAE